MNSLDEVVTVNDAGFAGYVAHFGAQNAEAAIQAELVAERARIDGLVTQAGTFATRQNVSDANQAGAMSAVSAMWDEAGIVMPAGLAMPDGSVSQ